MDKREAAELQMLAAIKVWLDCEFERRPSSGALGRLIEKYAAEFAHSTQTLSHEQRPSPSDEAAASAPSRPPRG